MAEANDEVTLEELAGEAPKPRRGRPPKKASEPTEETKTDTRDDSEDIGIEELMGEVTDAEISKSEKLSQPVTDTEIAEEEIETAKPASEESPEEISVRFLDSGLLVGNRVRFRDEVVTFVVGSPRYEELFDSNGDSWITLVDDREGQLERFGHVRFERA